MTTRPVEPGPAPLPGPPVPTWRSRSFDVIVVGAVVVFGLLFYGQRLEAVPLLLSMAQILPLLFRRTHPSLSFAVVAAATAIQVPLTDMPIMGQVAMPIALYSVTAYGPRPHGRAALAVCLVGGVVGPLDWFGNVGYGLGALAAMLISTELIVVASWAFGSLTRTRRLYVEQLIDRGRRLEVEAAQRAELAASEERARIAREMHDVVAHGLSVMVVQADGARYAAEKDPRATVAALETISATGRESLAEMRRMLGLLRGDDAGTDVRPQPGLADLAGLLAEAAAAGTELTMDLEQPLPAAGPGTGLTVYRVVQEALTNVRKHAGPGARVHVSVRTFGHAVRVRVEDDGRGASAPDDGRGHGVVGMRERVAAMGGHLDIGPRPGGGYRVEAVVPLGAA